MSREIQYDSSQRAVVDNLYAAIFNAQLQVWNGSEFVELSTAPLAAACLVQLGELGAGPLYAADMPEGIVTLDPSLAGVYYCQFFDQSSASIASPAVLTTRTAVGEQILASDVTNAVSGLATAMWSNTQRTLTGTGGAIGPTAGISTADIPFRCHPGQTLPLAGQVYDGSGQYATIGETASIAYTVTDCDTGESVAGMIGVALTPASVLYDTLQSSAVASNYNLLFSWTAPAKRGTYLIAMTFTGTTGRTWEAYFRGQVEW